MINRTTKSERRTFKLLAQRTKGPKLYVDLFDFIAQKKSYDEEAILKKFPSIKKTQLSNLKAQLFKQVLRAIRDAHKDTYVSIKAREHFDFAKVLYAKGLYVASLDMLQRVKKLAAQTYNEPLLYLAINFEKQIESQHVTGSMHSKAKKLSNQSADTIHSLALTDILSSLSLRLYGIYLERGIVWDQEDRVYLTQFFETNMPTVNVDALNFYQRLYLFQSYVWYYHMLQDFPKYYRYASRWLELFKTFPEMQKPETVQMIKAYNNVLNALFMSEKVSLFEKHLDEFITFNSSGYFDLSTNEFSQWKLFTYVHRINQVFLSADYKEAPDRLSDIIDHLEQPDIPYDLNRTIVFRYKIACVYFGAANLERAIYHLNAITNFAYKGFKQDIQTYARILNLIAHFDLGNERLVSYQVKNVYRALLRMQEMSKVHQEIFRFIRKTPSILPKDIRQEFIKLKQTLEPLGQDPVERRPFLYLDIISWLDSKIDNISMMEAIKRRKGL